MKIIFFAGIFCTNAIHHFNDKSGAFKEAFRVLQENGIFIIFISTKEQRKLYWINFYFQNAMKKID